VAIRKHIEEEQTTQWPKEKVQKDKQRSTNHTHKPKDRVTQTPLKTGMNSGAPEGKQFLLHKWHPSCKSSYKPGNK
jgi:hypothetical protein